jgi:hypothetical protein
VAKAQDDVANAKWAAIPVTVDGSPAEWPRLLNFYDAGTHLLFAISNDSANIYLCFESKDVQSQRKIMRAGMVVEIITKGKGKRDGTISFPLPPKEREDAVDGSKENNNPAGSGEGLQDDFSRQKEAFVHRRFLTDNIVMDVKGFASTNGLVPVKGKDIAAAMNWDSAGNLFYELAIPFDELFEKGYTVKDMAKEITLIVELPGLAQPPGRQNDVSFGGSTPGGGFGSGNRGGRTVDLGRALKGNTDRSGMYRTTRFKQKFVLAGTAVTPNP